MTTSHIAEIKAWFEKAVPTPDDKARCVQLGCHYEEVSEMMTATNDQTDAAVIEDLAYSHKNAHRPDHVIAMVQRNDLLDALCDQIVTAIGVAHMFGFDISGALYEVNRSNWSKFDADGNPIFNATGKIAKGPNYTPPELSKFVGQS